MMTPRSNDWNVKRSADLIRYQLMTAADYGVAAEFCLKGVGISANATVDRSHEITAKQMLTASRRFVQLLGDRPGIGLDAGRRIEVTHCGYVGSMMQSSPTLRIGLDRVFLDHIELTRTLNDINFRDSEGELHVVVSDRRLPKDVRRFLAEVDMAGMIAVASDITRRKDSAKRVELRFAEPPNVEQYREALRCPVLFGCAENIVVFDASVVDQPLPRAYDATAKHAEEQCHQILSRRSGRINFTGQVLSLLHSMVGPIPGLEKVASELALAPRTLRHHLQAEGISFRRLANEARQDLAVEMLGRPDLTVNEVGERLGYADPSSFFRAFKRRNGLSPRAFQRRQQGVPQSARSDVGMSRLK